MTNDSNRHAKPGGDGSADSDSRSASRKRIEEDFDERVAAKLSAFGQVEAPDVDATWGQITSPATKKVTPNAALDLKPARRWMPAIAAGIVVVGFGILAVLLAHNQTGNEGVSGLQTQADSGADNESQPEAGHNNNDSQPEAGHNDNNEAPQTPTTSPEEDIDLEACDVLRGSEPWITLFDAQPSPACVIIGEFQTPQVWNKGVETTTVEWVDGPHVLASDTRLDTGPATIGDLLEVGPNRFVSEPYAMPVIVLMDSADSLTAGISAFNPPVSFGGITTGMTLAEVGIDIAVDPDMLPSPTVHAAYVVGDPYSPVFIVVGDGGPTSVIAAIQRDTSDLADLTPKPECGSEDPALGQCLTSADIEIVELLLTGGALPVHPDATVSLGTGGVGDVTQQFATTDGTSPWLFDIESFAASEGPFDLREILDGLDPKLRGGQFDVTIGEHPHCAAPPLSAPAAATATAPAKAAASAAESTQATDAQLKVLHERRSSLLRAIGDHQGLRDEAASELAAANARIASNTRETTDLIRQADVDNALVLEKLNEVGDQDAQLTALNEELSGVLRSIETETVDPDGAFGPGLAGIRQISIQPVATSTCLNWFAIDVFVDSDGLIRAIRWEIWEP